MNRIGILGLSWRHVAPEQLASWTLPPPERAARLPRLARELGVHELVYVATCNRVEVAFVAEPGEPLAAYRPRLWRALRGVEPAPGEAERGLRAWGGEGAVEHLFLVAAGLDSARVGETEIAAQVREAHDLARALGLAGPRLTRVFDEALRIARRVHALTAVGAGRVSLAELAIAELRGTRGDGRLPVALLGVSPMTERAGCELASAGVPLLVVNRTLAKAEELAARLGAAALSLEAFAASPPPLRALLSAVRAPAPVVGRATLEHLVRDGQPLLVDMGVPPNIDPAASRALGLQRIGMDELSGRAARNRDARLGELGDAREIVDAALVRLARRLSERRLGPLQAALHERFRATAAEQAEQLLRAEFAGLDAARAATLRDFGETLARHLAHLPSAGLRELAERHGMEAVESFVAAADPDLRAALERALDDDSLPSAEPTEDDPCAP